MTHEYSSVLFTTANHWSLCRAKRWQSTKEHGGEMHVWIWETRNNSKCVCSLVYL